MTTAARIRSACTTLLVLGAACLVLAPPASAGPTGTAQRRALLIYATWDAGNGSPASAPDATLDDVAAAVRMAARDWYWQVSHEQFQGWDVQALGPVKIAAPTIDGPNYCGPTFRSTLSKAADDAARARGVDPASFNNVIYYYGRIPCGPPGFAFDQLIWLNGDKSTPTVVQELGHTFGLEHGYALRCKDAAGNPVTFSTSCALVDYGDPFTAMSGGRGGSFTAIEQSNLGWLAGRTQTMATAGGTYVVAPLEQVAPAVQVLKVPDGSGTLWLEYRRPIGVDATMYPATPVVLVHRTTAATGAKSVLLDMRPGTPAGFLDAGLTAGMSFTSPSTGSVITVRTTGDAGAEIHVRVQTRTVPNVVGMTKSAATTAVQQAGFVVRSASQLDETCEDVGMVMRQSPAGGTTAPLGSTVTIYVGTAPRTGCP